MYQKGTHRYEPNVSCKMKETMISYSCTDSVDESTEDQKPNAVVRE